MATSCSAEHEPGQQLDKLENEKGKEVDERGEGGEAGEGKSVHQGTYTRLGFVCVREKQG